MRMSPLLFVIAAATLAGAQQNSEILLHQDFEGQLSGWSTIGPEGVVRIVKDPGAAHGGTGTLAFTYEIKPGQIAAAVLPATPALARMESLRFWLKIDRQAPVGVLFSERKPGGGNYTAVVWAPANGWQLVELTPTDFVLAEGPDDPKDPDGKLDLDQLQGIGIFDLSGFFRAPNGQAAGAAGPHTIWIDDFDALAGPTPAPTSALRIDSFDRGFLSWIATAATDLKIAPAANPLAEPAMQASYEQTEEPFPSLVRRLSNFDLSKATRLEFDIASDKEATIAIGLETHRPGAAQGPRFNLPIYPPGDREVFHVSVKLDDFQGQGKLDPAQLRTVILTDASAANSGSLGRNTIWIGKLEFR
jgi:hypothetical protein